MMRFIVFMFAVICFVNANPTIEESDSASIGEEGADAGRKSGLGTWPSAFPRFPQFTFPQLPQFQFPKMQLPQFQPFQVQKPLSAQDILNMKPAPGGVVAGISQSVSSHTDYVDGKPVVKTHGQTIWNKNGIVNTETYGN